MTTTLGYNTLECPYCGRKRVWAKHTKTWQCPHDSCTTPEQAAWWAERRQAIDEATQRHWARQ